MAPRRRRRRAARAVPSRCVEQRRQRAAHDAAVLGRGLARRARRPRAAGHGRCGGRCRAPRGPRWDRWSPASWPRPAPPARRGPSRRSDAARGDELLDLRRRPARDPLGVAQRAQGERPLERLDQELDAPRGLVLRAEAAAERLLVGLLGGLAVGARHHLARVRQAALGAEAEDPGGLRVGLAERVDAAEDEVLRADADAVAVARAASTPRMCAPLTRTPLRLPMSSTRAAVVVDDDAARAAATRAGPRW